MLSLDIIRLNRGVDWGRRIPKVPWKHRWMFHSHLFLARLLDALLAGVEGALLALGRLLHFLPSLGV